MRSGSLPIVDGRYRTGTRLGPPVESQVRVQRGRNSIDLTKDVPIRSTRANPRAGSAAGVRYQGIETPPLGRSIWPVMNEAASETR